MHNNGFGMKLMLLMGMSYEKIDSNIQSFLMHHDLVMSDCIVGVSRPKLSLHGRIPYV